MAAVNERAGDPGIYTLRHIGPGVNQSPNIPTFTILNQTNISAKPLPVSHLPHSRDFSQGSWTGRLGDAGQFTITFPNTEASDGVPWRNRFNPSGMNQFVEIYRDDNLEFVGSIEAVNPIQQSITVSGYDGMFLLKKAYESDFVSVMAPRDVIERYSQVWVLGVADPFTGVGSGSPGLWTVGGTSPTYGPSAGQINLGVGGTLTGPISAVNQVTNDWRITFSITSLVGRLDLSVFRTALEVCSWHAGGPSSINIGGGLVIYDNSGSGILTTPGLSLSALGVPSPANPWLCEFGVKNGWLYSTVNGQYTSWVRLGSPRQPDTVVLSASGGAVSLVGPFVTRVLVPFLMRGTDKGDHVLPGGVTTYPVGGLHGRYYNDLDISGLAGSGMTYYMLSPPRSVAAPPGTYADRLDATVDTQANPSPGASTSYWSALWFGSVYLKLSQGAYTITLSNVSQIYYRLWLGKTQWNDQLMDGVGSPVTVSTGTFEGKDGWYPIIVEAKVTSVASGAPTLNFTPSSSYTDPGGTALTGGVTVVIPSSSLSPLGCVDQRFQGQSHFDIVQKTAQAYGYQVACEPMSLESGEFPGRMAPRLREGRDTDIVLEADIDDKKNPIINYSNVTDATDQVSSLRGNGAGIPNQSGATLQAEVLDITALNSGLFDLQGWQDASDISFSALLAARLNSQLGLQLAPWQNVTGDPTARDTLSDSFPLTGSLAAMRWRPGDGVRLRLRDVNVDDLTPRQITQIQRDFGPEGRNDTKAVFRARPKSAAYAQRVQTARGVAGQRTFQGNPITLPANLISEDIGPLGASTIVCTVPILANDRLVSCTFQFIRNDSAVPMGLYINVVDQTVALGGPWVTSPCIVDCSPFFAPDPFGLTSGGRITFNILNKSAVTTGRIEGVAVIVVRR